MLVSLTPVTVSSLWGPDGGTTLNVPPPSVTSVTEVIYPDAQGQRCTTSASDLTNCPLSQPFRLQVAGRWLPFAALPAPRFSVVIPRSSSDLSCVNVTILVDHLQFTCDVLDATDKIGGLSLRLAVTVDEQTITSSSLIR